MVANLTEKAGSIFSQVHESLSGLNAHVAEQRESLLRLEQERQGVINSLIDDMRGHADDPVRVFQALKILTGNDYQVRLHEDEILSNKGKSLPEFRDILKDKDLAVDYGDLHEALAHDRVYRKQMLAYLEDHAESIPDVMDLFRLDDSKLAQLVTDDVLRMHSDEHLKLATDVITDTYEETNAAGYNAFATSRLYGVILDIEKQVESPDSGVFGSAQEYLDILGQIEKTGIVAENSQSFVDDLKDKLGKMIQDQNPEPEVSTGPVSPADGQ